MNSYVLYNRKSGEESPGWENLDGGPKQTTGWHRCGQGPSQEQGDKYGVNTDNKINLHYFMQVLSTFDEQQIITNFLFA